MPRRWNQIQSRIDEIEKLRILPIPSTPIDIVQAARTDTTVVLIDKIGRIYSTQANGSTFWTTTNRLARTVDCLIKLKALSPQAVEQHKAAIAADEAERERRWSSARVLKDAATAGVKLTAAQARKLAAQCRPEDLERV